jgi:hypothetical protein
VDFGATQSFRLAARPTGAGATAVYANLTIGNYAVTYDSAGKVWGDPELMFAGTYFEPTVAYNQAGTRSMVASLSQPGQMRLISVRSRNGAVWSPALDQPPVVLDVSTGGNFDSLATALFANGDAMVAWRANTATDNKTLASRYHVADSTWDANAIIDEDGMTGQPVIRIDASDRVTIAYHHGNDTWARRNLGSGWTAGQDLGDAETVNLTMDATGNLSVPLGAHFEGTTKAFIRRLPAIGSAWGPAYGIPVGPINAVTRLGVALTTDPDGTPVLVAREAPGTFGTARAIGAACPASD